MNRVRNVLATLLLCGFAVLGVLLLGLALFVLGLDTDSSSVLGTLIDAFGVLLLGAALMMTVPAVAALMLRPRRPTAAGAVASMLGLGVFAATASQATTDVALLALNLGGLALLLCALPLPARRPEVGDP